MEETQNEDVEFFDWRDTNLMTQVRNQRDCSCCWAITAASAVEFLVNKQSTIPDNELVVLSPQHLIDHVVDDLSGHELDDRGCYRLHYNKAFRYIITHGISKETDYPFRAERRSIRPSPKPFLKISGYQRIDISRLKNIVQQQPVAAAMRYTEEIKSWGAEIYKGPSNPEGLKMETLRHAVLVVGFGKDDNGEKYWIVKTSWGKEWGVCGYGRVSQNLCGEKYLLESLYFPQGIEYV